MLYTSRYPSPLGEILLSADDGGLTGLWFDGQKYFASTLSSEHGEKETEAIALAKEWLDEYFQGRVPQKTPPLSLIGTDFRKSVWQFLLTIPYGTTVTYGTIAKALSKEIRVSPRAVGGAVGHNPISLIIPCHRVIGADGSLTGYAGGIDRKIALLRLEGVPLKGLPLR